MNSYKTNLYADPFSHIYIESSVAKDPLVTKILNKFPKAKQIPISHYKDVFCRGKQDFIMQKQSPSLILATKDHNLLYKGAPVCQSFGNKHFYYTSCVMNCIYDCEYCYLQGMYSSANLVVFVNLQDIFREVEELLAMHPVYLCISYDTDLLALEGMLGYVREWIFFAKTHPNLTIEIRTKSANFAAIKDIPSSENIILAWTLSPDIIATSFEHQAPSLNARLQSVSEAMEQGYPLRLCFDPLLQIDDFNTVYKNFIDEVFQSIDYKKLFDVSTGIFRVSNDYLKRMKKQRPLSQIIQFPYINRNGISYYGEEKAQEMMMFMRKQLSGYIPEEKIFEWSEIV